MDGKAKADSASDPLGYGASAYLKWGLAQTQAGYPVDISKPATAEDLKDPILWLSQAHALAQAAINVVGSNPDLRSMPSPIQDSCDCQYHAVALMLVGYSLEICLKAMIIMKDGIDDFMNNETKVRHHRLQDLADFVPDLSKKDKAILRALTHYVYWAGRYPDPGFKRSDELEGIFDIAEKHQVTGHDLFDLSSRVMRHATEIANQLE